MKNFTFIEGNNGFYYYNHDLKTAMKYYKLYLEKHIDGEFYKTVNDRVLNIKNMYGALKG